MATSPQEDELERMLFELARANNSMPHANAVRAQYRCPGMPHDHQGTETEGTETLTLEQKCMLATMQLDLLQQQALHDEKEHLHAMAALHAQASSLRDVVAHAQHDVDQLPPPAAESAAPHSVSPEATAPTAQWLEERCKRAAAATSKLNSTHRTLKMQVGVLTQQLAAAQHEEVKDIDLEQLRIENTMLREQLAQAARTAADARRDVSAAIKVRVYEAA